MPEYKLKEAFNVGDSARYHAERTPDKIATIYEDRVTTFAQLDRYGNQVANGLIKLGVKPQERVGYYGKNTDYHPQILSGAVVPGTSAPCCFAAHITTCSTHATTRCFALKLPVRTT